MSKEMEYPVSRRVANNTKAILKAYGLKVADLEREVELSPGYLSRCLSGKRCIGIDNIVKILKYFRFTEPEQIFNFIYNDISLNYQLQEVELEIQKTKNELDKLNARRGKLLKEKNHTFK